MAKKDLATIQVGIDAAAVQMNNAFADTVTAGQMANEFRGGYQPLRKFENLFVLDVATSKYVLNTAYIDAAYAGNMPRSNRRRMKKLEPFT